MPNESRILEISSYGLARRGRLKDLFFTLLSASCPPQCIDTFLHVWLEPYVWATSTGATVDVDALSRGATLGASSAVF